MTKPIIFTDPETEEKFTLEFSRESVVFTNRQGFKLSDFNDNIEEMLPILWYGAFRKNHKNVSRQKTDHYLFDVLEGLTDAQATRLIQLYGDPRKALIKNDEEDGKNASKMLVMED